MSGICCLAKSSCLTAFLVLCVQVSKNYKMDNIVCWVGVTSASVDRDVMMSFAGPNGTLVQIKAIEGRDVRAFSPYKEGEFLLMPNAKYDADACGRVKVGAVLTLCMN